MIGNIFGRGAQGPEIAEEYRSHMARLQIEQLEMQSADQRRIQADQQTAQYNRIHKTPPPPRFDPNTSEAFQIPLSQAVTLWKLKFGDKWFDAHQARPEVGKDFYTDVFDRIQKAELFENINGWYRLKEDV
jgi:hypothetical protein